MADRRAEPFVLALSALRQRLRRGQVPRDTRLAASEIAAELGLSATPVREALSRLAGEGLLDDRRGEGFFVRRLGRADIAALYRLSLAHLALAVEGLAPDAPEAEPGGAEPPFDPVEAVERRFAAWAACGGRALAQSHARLQAQLGAVRRLEPRLFDDLAEEAEALLAAAEPGARRARLRAFHLRRARAAGRLAELMEAGPGVHPL